MSGALVDFGLYFFHNVHVRMANGSAPYYYLPKMETHQETRLWNDVFKAAQDYMKVPQGKFIEIICNVYLRIGWFVSSHYPSVTI